MIRRTVDLDRPVSPTDATRVVRVRATDPPVRPTAPAARRGAQELPWTSLPTSEYFAALAEHESGDASKRMAQHLDVQAERMCVVQHEYAAADHANMLVAAIDRWLASGAFGSQKVYAYYSNSYPPVRRLVQFGPDPATDQLRALAEGVVLTTYRGQRVALRVAFTGPDENDTNVLTLFVEDTAEGRTRADRMLADLRVRQARSIYRGHWITPQPAFMPLEPKRYSWRDLVLPPETIAALRTNTVRLLTRAARSTRHHHVAAASGVAPSRTSRDREGADRRREEAREARTAETEPRP